MLYQYENKVFNLFIRDFILIILTLFSKNYDFTLVILLFFFYVTLKCCCTSDREKSCTCVLSSLFVSDLRLRLEYLNSVEKQYGVRPQTLGGGARDLKTVNDWFKQQTGGKVEQVVPSPLSRKTALLPVGAASFKGKWTLDSFSC